MADSDIQIFGALRTMTGDGIAAYAEQIYDTESGKFLPELLEESSGIKQAQVGYFVCDTAAATAAKTIAATGYALATGGNIRIKMTNANTAGAVTLNINNTGAKALFYNGAQASSANSWEAGETLEVYYDGTQFQAINISSLLKDLSEKVDVVKVYDNTRFKTNSGKYLWLNLPSEVISQLNGDEGYFYFYEKFVDTSTSEYAAPHNTNTDGTITNLGNGWFKAEGCTKIGWRPSTSTASAYFYFTFYAYPAKTTEAIFRVVSDLLGRQDMDEQRYFGGDTEYMEISPTQNGTFANTGNAYAVRYLNKETKLNDKLKIKVTKPVSTEGGYYRVGIGLTNELAPTSSDTGVRSKEVLTLSASDEFVESSLDFREYKYIHFQLNEYDALGNNVVVRTSTEGISKALCAQFMSIGIQKKFLSIDEILKRIDTETLQAEIDEINNILTDDAYKRNKEKEIQLVAAKRLRHTSVPLFQMAVITDTHGQSRCVKNTVTIADGFNTIDAVAHLGDAEAAYYGSSTVEQIGRTALLESSKQVLVAVGNHDAGNSRVLVSTIDTESIHNRFVLPYIDAGFIPNNNGKNYYYKDFDENRMRVIVLYPYCEDDNTFNETYWKAIPYDSSYPNVAFSTTYEQGDKVNARNGYTDYSFEAVQQVTTDSTRYNHSLTFPSYQVSRSHAIFSQAQLEWLCDVLVSTPANYGVAILMHQEPSDSFVTIEGEFSQESGRTAAASLCGDIVADIVEAFRTGSNFTKEVVYTGVADYMGSFTLNKDFSLKNTGAKFMCYITGHHHRDSIYKHNTYTQYVVSCICGIVDDDNGASNDIARTTGDGKAHDCVTVVTFNVINNKVTLVKIGVDQTMDGKQRKYQVINLLQ